MSGAVGLDVLNLATDDAWVTLRSFQIDFVDDRVMRVKSSIAMDFDVIRPTTITRQSDQRWRNIEPLLIPIAARLPPAGAHIELLDEDGRIVPVLSALQERRLLANGLAAFTKVYGHNTDSIGVLRTKVFEYIRPGSNVTLSDVRDKYFPFIDEYRAKFNEYLEFIADNRLVIAAMEGVTTGARRVVSYSYEAPLDRPIIVENGRVDFSLKFALGGPTSNAEIKVNAPHDMSFYNVGIYRLDNGSELPVADADQVSLLNDALHVVISGQTATTNLKCVGSMALRPTGLIRSAVYTSWLTVVTLLAAFLAPRLHGQWLWEYIADNASPDALVALLLLVPGTVSAYTAMPSKHILTTTALFQTRRRLWASGALSFAAALAIGFTLPMVPMVIAWVIVSAATTLIAWKLTTQYGDLSRLDNLRRPLGIGTAVEGAGDATA